MNYMNDIRDIRRTINQEIVKKIFGNKKNAIIFLSYFNYDGNMWSRKSSSEVYNEIVRIWNYDEAKDKLREIFKNTPKYLRGLEGENNINILISEWRNLGLGNISWPFSQGQFDNFAQ